MFDKTGVEEELGGLYSEESGNCVTARTRVHIPRTYGKPVWPCLCDPSAPMAKWEVETGETL